MKKSINFLALTLDVLSLLSLRGAIYSSILGAILFISCNEKKENKTPVVRAHVWDSVVIGDGVVFSDTTMAVSYNTKISNTIQKKKHVKVSEQNINFHLKEDYSALDSVVMFTLVDVFLPVYDTAKVIMLICDTTGQAVYTTDYKTMMLTDNTLYWQFGYKVYHNGQYKLDGEVPCDYLDENKKPLSQNIIVWLSK